MREMEKTSSKSSVEQRTATCNSAGRLIKDGDIVTGSEGGFTRFDVGCRSTYGVHWMV